MIDTHGMTELGYLILLDRYAQKKHGECKVGDIVVALMDNDSKDMSQKRELATVKKVFDNEVEIELSNGDDKIISKRLIETPLETSPQDVFERVATAIAKVENPEKQNAWKEKFKWLMDDFKFVPGGRILYGAGSGNKVTNFNCVSAETLIHTEEGLIAAKDLAGKTIKVLSEGGVYRHSTWNNYGIQRLWEVTLKNGDTLYATEDHEWITLKNGYKRIFTTAELQGHSIPMQHVSNIQTNHDDPVFRKGVQHGYVYGDGTIQHSRGNGEITSTRAYVPAFTEHNKKFVSKWFDNVGYQPSRDAVVGNNLPKEWKNLPDINESKVYLLGFIAGLIAADGHVDKRGSTMLHQSDLKELVKIRQIAAKVGLPVVSIKLTRDINPWTGEYAPLYKMQFVKAAFAESNLILLDTHYKNMEVSLLKKSRKLSVKVVSVRPTNRIEEVFCCVEPETHTMVIEGGYLTKQCYVLPSPDDSRGGILDSVKTMTEIMSRGGGVGLNISSLRPKNAYVKGVNGRSSGSVSWGALYSFVTGLIEQGGSRRGALMLILNDWHPDVFRFINSKREAGKIVNANISIGISDSFMLAVKQDLDWNLRFPDTQFEKYSAEWNGDLEEWEAKGYPVIVYETVKARKVWDSIIESAWASAEPGLWFRERSNKMSNSWYYPEGKLVSTNPCGEQPLSGNAVCNLGAINLSKFAKNGEFDKATFKKAVAYAVRFLDNVIDDNFYFYDKNEEQQTGERRIGLGIMGLAELLIKCKIRYGSEEAAKFVENLFFEMAKTAYLTSAEIASEKGSFKFFDAEKFLQSGHMKNMPDDVRNTIAEKGCRNVTLLTIAPVGSTGTMVNTSTGIEPFFSWEWYRKGRLGYFAEKAQIVNDWLIENNIDPTNNYTLPSYFANAMELTPYEHVVMQAAAQKWIDAAISKTNNLPNNYTVQQVSDFYMQLYDLGCKGGTVYRDGSRDEQVLTLKNEENTKSETQQVVETPAVQPEKKQLKLQKRSSQLNGKTFKGQTPYGSVFVTVNEDENQNPLEIFVNISKSGSDLAAQAEAIGRLLSLSLQMQPSEFRLEALKILVDQIVGIGGARQVGLGKNKVASLPDAIAKILLDKYLAKHDTKTIAITDGDEVKVVRLSETSDVHDTNETEYSPSISLTGANFCPSCTNMSLIRVDGCHKCEICGYSEC